MIEEFEIPKQIYYFNEDTLSIDVLTFNKINHNISKTWKVCEYIDEKNELSYIVSHYYIPIVGWNIEYDFKFNPSLEILKEKAYLKQLSEKDYKESQIETLRNDMKKIEQNIKYLKFLQNERKLPNFYTRTL